jgi:hypothetical protein
VWYQHHTLYHLEYTMKAQIASLILFATLLIGSQASAQDPIPEHEFALRAHHAEMLGERIRRTHQYQEKVLKLRYNQFERRGPTVQVPELDAKASGAALALLIGGALVLVDRRKRVAGI